MRKCFAFSSDFFQPNSVDEAFREQAAALEKVGVPVGTIAVEQGTIRLPDSTPSGCEVVFRGWMMTAEEYNSFQSLVDRTGGRTFHSLEQYLHTHHLPNWYPELEGLTAETVFFPSDIDLAEALADLDWPGYFLKDYVKSLKTSVGSVIRDLSEAPRVAEEMRHFRGEIEGGFAVRRLEAFMPDTERRYFVIDGTAHAPNEERPTPEIVSEAAQRVSKSRFFSVDVARTKDGQDRIVEVGDGQVSDLVGWSPERFAQLWR